MKIFLATDHAGFALKEEIKEYLKSADYDVVDFGAYTEEEGDDYPDFIKQAATAISESTDDEKAIIFGGSGQGENIVANRFPGVRSVVFYGGPLDIITLSREHNDANILSLGARFVTPHEAKEVVGLWLSTRFSGEDRHVRRICKIER